MKSFTSFDGLPISYEVLGTGPAVLLHHGFASDSRTNWVRSGLADAIADSGRSVVLIDARGHGESGKPHDPASYAGGAMARDVSALLDHLGLEAVHVIGYSMGSFVAITLAVGRQAEPRLRSVVLGGAGQGQAGLRESGMTLAIAEALEADDKTTITSRTALAFRNFADATRADRLALAAIQRSRSSTHDMSHLDRITVPTLVVNGEADTLVGPPRSLAEAIPGARFLAVPGDHLSAVGKPEFRVAVLGWLGEVAGQD
ncbi:MAG: alpha/beta fold hydrolase [Acidimicrobiales bacterium]